MLSLSLRAVFRNESWMFCAGLLLSIADLLRFFNLQHTISPLPQPPGQPQTTSMFFPASPPEEHGGTTCLLAARFPKAAWQVAASTIRRPPVLFNLEVAETGFLTQCEDVPRCSLSYRSPSRCVQSPAWAIPPLRNTPHPSSVMRYAKVPVKS